MKAFTALAWTVSLVSALPAAAQTTVRVNVTSNGIQAMGGLVQSNESSISGNGQFVAFNSFANNLVPNDNNSSYDVFVHDRITGALQRVSVSTAGVEGNSSSTSPSMSTDGRYVLFRSGATNLVTGDTNGVPDLFIRDRTMNTTTRISVTSTGGQPNADSTFAEISGDGKFVTFSSDATNMVPGDTNAVADIFVRDLVAGTTSRVSISTASVQANGASNNSAISNNGRYVAFGSGATNLVTGDTNGFYDIFLRDRTLNTTTRISLTTLMAEANDHCDQPSISGDGNFIAWPSTATNLVTGDTNAARDVFRKDRVTGALVRVSLSSASVQGNGTSTDPSLSLNGRYVLFRSAASNLVVNDLNAQPDIFRRDVQLGQTILISLDTAGNQANDFSNCGGYGESISDDARFATFYGAATNLVVADTNGDWDIFLRDTLAMPCPPITSYCVAKVNSLGCVPVIGASGLPSASGQGVLFATALQVLSQKFGIFIWGQAPAALPFKGGVLCVNPPITRAPGQTSTGTLPTDCSGTYSFKFDTAYMTSQGLVMGDDVYGQFWSRDQGFAPPNNVGLTDGISFTICP